MVCNIHIPAKPQILLENARLPAGIEMIGVATGGESHRMSDTQVERHLPSRPLPHSTQDAADQWIFGSSLISFAVRWICCCFWCVSTSWTSALPIALVTDQYLAHLEVLEQLDVNDVGIFWKWRAR